MIPKVIHCIWLSGDDKPKLYQECINSWHDIMPGYEVKEWSMSNLPEEVLNHSFVASAIQAKKWAFAADYIRLWLLYTYGGVYLDMDVMVYKKFDPFLNHSAFGCIEFNPRNFYKYIQVKKADHIFGLNIEAAILGAIAKHEWIKSMMDFYENLTFINSPQFYNTIIMPLIVTQKSINLGFKYIPIYQVLKGDIHIYPSDVFSSCYDMSITACNSYKELGRNNIRYAVHLCAHSWYEFKDTKTNTHKIKAFIIKILGKQNIKRIKEIRKQNQNIIFRNL